jgi:hypothetical protein
MVTDREIAEDFELQMVVIARHREGLFREFDAELAAISHVRDMQRRDCRRTLARAIFAPAIHHMRTND